MRFEFAKIVKTLLSVIFYYFCQVVFAFMEKDNLVNSLVLNLNLADEKDKNGFVANTDKLYDDCFFPVIDEVISRFGAVYDADIDDVIVDLGTANVQDLPNLLSEALEEALLKKIDASEEKSDCVDFLAVDNDAFPEAAKTLLQHLPDPLKNVSTGKAMISFLFSGEAPWQIELADFHPNEDLTQLLEVLKNDVPSLKLFLSEIADNDVAFSRLTNLLDLSQLRELCLILMCFTEVGDAFDELLDYHFDANGFLVFLSICGKVALSAILYSLSKDGKSVVDRIVVDYQKDKSIEALSIEALKKDVFPIFGVSDESSVVVEQQEQMTKTNGLECVEMEEKAAEDDAVDDNIKGKVYDDDYADYQEDEFYVDSETDNKGVPVSKKNIGQSGFFEIEEKHDGTLLNLDPLKIEEDVKAAEGKEKAEANGNDAKVGKTNSTLECSTSNVFSGDSEQQTDDRLKSEYLSQLEKEFAAKKERIENQFVVEKCKLTVDDAGLVLLHPFLSTLFSRMGLLDEKNHFKGLTEREKAAHLLRFASGDANLHFDHLMNLEKVFCGLPVQYPMMPDFPISNNEKLEVNDMLESVCQYWKPLNGTSVAGLQQSFLRRNGMIAYDGGTWLIRVEGMAVDILLDDLPWEISTILFPWTDDMFAVDWQRGY